MTFLSHKALAHREAAWCIDASTRDSIRTRRNALVGLWAGRRMGLKDAALEAYARDVVLADFEETGDGDLVRKISADFAARGIDVPAALIRREINEKHLTAFLQTAMTD